MLLLEQSSFTVFDMGPEPPDQGSFPYLTSW